MSAFATALGDRTQEVGALTLRYLRRLAREKFTLMFTLLQPLFWLILFGSLFSVVGGGFQGVQGGDYLTFVLPGIVVLNVLGAGLAAGTDVMFDKENGFLNRLLAAPISRLSVIVARLLYVAANSLLQVVVLLAVALAMGAALPGGLPGIAVIILVAVLLALALGSISLILAFALKGHGEFFAVIGFTNMPLFFLSSALLPIAAMPGWMQVLARVNPLTWAIDVARAAAVEGVPWDVLPQALGALLLADAVCLALAVRTFRTKLD